MNLFDAYTNKRVEFKYCGGELNLRLSHALFSSYSIDAGSRLLLKTIAKQVKLDSDCSILDVGTGIGILGLSLKRAYPESSLTLQDRDALAVKWALNNAEENGIEANGFGAVALDGLETDQKFDLIVSNLPAKAGNPVLRDFFFRVTQHLKPGGTVAVVIVHTLSELAEEAIEDSGGTISYTEKNKNYSIYHFTGSGDKNLPALDRIYKRQTSRFRIGKLGYQLNCLWSLPEFDTVAYGTELAAKAIESLYPKSFTKALFWEPGQGHLPVWFKTKSPSADLTLAGRDKLGLAAPIGSLQLTGMNAAEVHHLGDFTLLPEATDQREFDLICFPWHPIPEAKVEQKVFSVLNTLLAREGAAAVYGKSAAITNLLKAKKGFIKVREWKNKGFKAVIIKRNI